MDLKKTIFLVLLLFSSNVFCFSQNKNSVLKFTPVFGNEKLEYRMPFFLPRNADTVIIESFKFYISNVSFMYNGDIIYQPENSYHLIDPKLNSEILIFTNTIQDFNQIKFDIGIDSSTSVSGVMGGDLDPTKGMYWTWQSGYINFKLEGISPKCNTRNNTFQFHIGGYLPPYCALQTITLPAKNKSKIEVMVDVKKFLDKIDLSQTNTIMSPGYKAVELAELYKSIFSTPD